MNNNNIKIPVKSLHSSSSVPKYAYKGDAGFDLRSSENATINPQERKVIKCGFCIQIPKGCAGLVIPRSGLAAKHGISVVNSPGLIDSGYRGEICVILLNTDKDNEFKISVGDRIAQMMIVPFIKADFCEVKELDASDRNFNAFGSSGINN